MKMFSIALVALTLSAPAQAWLSEAATRSPLPSVVLPPELDRVLRDYERAWRAHDAVALSELFTGNGFVLVNGHPPVRGRDAIRTAYSGAGGSLSLRAFAYATSADIGYIIGGYGPSLAAVDSGKFVLTLKRGANGHWLIMSDMDNANEHRSQRTTSDAAPTPHHDGTP
jgi:ketosteroid isomerase-like protein